MAEHSIDLVPNLLRGHKSNGRSVYDREAKRELVRRCLQPGVSLAATALAHGLNANLLRKWVVKQTGRSRSVARSPRLLAVAAHPAAVPEAVPAMPSPATATGHWRLELVVPGGTIRIRGKIDAESLRTVLDCLAGRA
jgi:transposase-like protein